MRNEWRIKFVREEGEDVCHLSRRPTMDCADGCWCGHEPAVTQFLDDWPEGTMICQDCLRELKQALITEEQYIAVLRSDIRGIYQNMRRISGVLGRIEGTEKILQEVEAVNEKWPNLWNRVVVDGELSGLVQEARLLCGKMGAVELEVDQYEYSGEYAGDPAGDPRVICRSVPAIQSLLLVSTRDLGQPFIDALEELCLKFRDMRGSRGNEEC